MRFDGCPDPCAFVDLEVIHDHDLPGMEAGNQNVFDIQFKGCGVRRSFQDEGRSPAFKGERSNQRDILATIPWHIGSGSFSPWRKSIHRCQLNVRAALINKDQRVR